MPPIWFWIMMIVAFGVLWYFMVYRFDRWLDSEHETFKSLLLENLEMGNMMSKVDAFERCGKKL
jgi:preprotein translocase subunit YajC